MPRTLLPLFFFASIVACSASTLEPKPLDVTIEANRTTAVPGDTIAFVVSAQGGQLLALEVSYGDSGSDLYGTGGARTAKVTFKHAYLLRGTYLVRAVVTDATAGQKEATVEVRVN